MAITFFTQSVKQVAPIWVRYREFNIDAKARTSLYIDKDRLKGSQVLKYKITSRDTQADKLAIQDKNKALDIIQSDMHSLEAYIRSQVTMNTNVTSKWLKGVLNPTEGATNGSLLDYYKLLLESNPNVSANSIRAYRGNASFMLRYQEYLGNDIRVSDVDGVFKEDFIKWGVSKGYPMGTIKFNLERLKAVCFYAESRGEVISNQVKNLTKGVKKHATEGVYLTLEDIDKIIALELEDKELDIARDWLVISCFIGQRSISLLNLTRDNINRPQLLITLKQVKTGVNVTIPILPQVQTILDKYNVNFPPRLKQTDRYNYHQYNTLIKEVCRLANISEVSKGRGRKGEGIKSKVVSKPKHELITSHIGRRSFATNFYGKMNMQSIMAITGHKTESSFLLYINKGRVEDTDKLRQEFLKALE